MKNGISVLYYISGMIFLLMSNFSIAQETDHTNPQSGSHVKSHMVPFNAGDVCMLHNHPTAAPFSQVNPDQSILSSARLTPFVVDVVRGDVMKLEVVVTDPEIESIAITGGYQFYEEIGTIVLTEDESNSESDADGRVFVSSDITLPAYKADHGELFPRVTLWNTMGTADSRHRSREHEVEITYKDGSTRNTSLHILRPFGAVNTGYMEPAAVTGIAENIQVSEYVVSISVTDTLSFPYYADKGYRHHIADAINRVYDYVEDVYDWIIIQDLSRRSQVYHIVAWREAGVYWDNQLFDMSPTFGSSNVLRGYLYDQMAWDVGYGQDWTRSNYNAFRLLNHEMLHTWAAFLPGELHLSVQAHWDYIEREDGCFGHGYGNWGAINFNEETKEFTFDRDLSTDKCNDLELYLMGLIPIDEVDDIRTLVNPRFEIIDNEFRYFADSLVTVTGDDILAALGHRIPTHENSQREFNALMVVLHDRLLTPVEMTLFDHRMREWEKPGSDIGMTFAHAVGGRATVSTKVRLKDEPTSIYIRETDLPATIMLFQNFPNPFNPSTVIRYGIPEQSHVTLNIYNSLGQRVATLVDEEQETGFYEFKFDASRLPSGVYIYRLKAGQYFESKKLVLLK